MTLCPSCVLWGTNSTSLPTRHQILQPVLTPGPVSWPTGEYWSLHKGHHHEEPGGTFPEQLWCGPEENLCPDGKGFTASLCALWVLPGINQVVIQLGYDNHPVSSFLLNNPSIFQQPAYLPIAASFKDTQTGKILGSVAYPFRALCSGCLSIVWMPSFPGVLLPVPILMKFYSVCSCQS